MTDRYRRHTFRISTRPIRRLPPSERLQMVVATLAGERYAAEQAAHRAYLFGRTVESARHQGRADGCAAAMRLIARECR